MPSDSAEENQSASRAILRSDALPSRLPARPVAQAGLALLALFALWTVLPILPPQLLDLRWQHKAATSLVDNSPLVVLAVGLIHAAALLEPSSRWLQDLRARIAALLLPAVCGYLLLIPLDVHATVNHIRLLDRQRQNGEQALQRRLEKALQIIDRAPDVTSLEAGLQSLQGPPLGSEERSLPVAELKQQLRQSLQRSFSAMQAQMVRVSPEMIVAMIRDSTRVVVTSLVIAVVLSALSFRESINNSLLGMAHFNLLQLRKSLSFQLAGQRGKSLEQRNRREYEKMLRRRVKRSWFDSIRDQWSTFQARRSMKPTKPPKSSSRKR